MDLVPFYLHPAMEVPRNTESTVPGGTTFGYIGYSGADSKSFDNLDSRDSERSRDMSFAGGSRTRALDPSVARPVCPPLSTPFIPAYRRSIQPTY